MREMCVAPLTLYVQVCSLLSKYMHQLANQKQMMVTM